MNRARLDLSKSNSRSIKDYSLPLDKLLTLGDPRGNREWPDYIKFGLGPESILDLIRMVTDTELNEADVESREVWAPRDAWRALEQLRAEAAIEPLMRLFHEQEEDDWASQELPESFGLIGPAAIPALIAYLADASHGLFPRISAVTGLESIAMQHTDTRADCIAALTRQLESFAEQDPTLNAFLISSLVEVAAVESAPVIEQAFAADCVDETIRGDWDDVQVDLGLKEPGEKQKQQARLIEELNRALSNPYELTSPATRISQPQKIGKKAKAKRKKASLSRKKNRRRR